MVAGFIIGLLVLLYPMISDYVNSLHQSRAIFDYEAALKYMTKEDYTAFFEKADKYNEALNKVDFPFMYYGEVPGYDDALNIDGTGIMGYVAIDKIQIELPIRHGVSSAVLSIGAGHVPGSSLPTGAVGTHTVISAHRGLPSATLFTYLNRLSEGDVFTVTIFDRVLTYRVDKVLITEPTDMAQLSAVEGKSYCTLLTCTPYGVNTQRLLVRGERVETAEAKPDRYISNNAFVIDPLIVAPLMAIPILVLIMVALMIKYSRERKLTPEQAIELIKGHGEYKE